MTEYEYKLDFEVRDYECDVQGVVNNAENRNAPVCILRISGQDSGINIF